MKNCPHCLSEIGDEVSVCPNCGKKTGDNAEVEKLINKMGSKSTKNIFGLIGFTLFDIIRFLIIAAIVLCVLDLIIYLFFGVDIIEIIIEKITDIIDFSADFLDDFFEYFF